MSIHTIRLILFNDAENTNRIIADIINSFSTQLRTVEHYNLVVRPEKPTFDPDVDV